MFLLLFCPLALTAQTKISGLVMDAQDKPLPNASVLLLQAKDSGLVKGTLTNREGGYAFINILPGGYIVATSFVGFRQVYSGAFEHNGKDITLPSLQLRERETALAAVTVTGKKPLFEQKMDRMVINVASSVTGVGSTALDVLERSPGIIVDRQNNSLSMNGKDGVVVMINNRISKMPISAVVQMLAGMNSGNIERIELITTPPANYDAEGNAGYINIVLKENTQFGTNGSYTLAAGYGHGPVFSPSLNFNHRTYKFNLFGDLSLSRNATDQEFDFYRKVLKGNTAIENYIYSARDPVVWFTNVRLGLDFQATKKTVIGGLFSGFDRRWTMDAFNTSNIFLDQQLDTVVRIINREIHNLRNYSANFNLLHNFSENERLSFDADYFSYRDHNPVDYHNSYFDGNGLPLFEQQTRSGKETPIRFWVSNADYFKKLGKKTELEAGVKASLSKFKNDVSVLNLDQGVWKTDPGLTANYDLNESVWAGYTSFSFHFSEKNSGKMGLRYEYTNSVLNSQLQKGIVDKHYGKLFPTAYFSHKINDNNSFNLSYSRRITRPTFNDMAPFVIFVDPNTFFSGNPSLQPSISNDVKGDYLFKSFVFSLEYAYEADPITNFSPKVDPLTNKQTLAAENQKSDQVVNFIVSLPLTLKKWWTMQNNVFGTWERLDAFYKGDPVVLKEKTLTARSTQTFSLPKDISLELSGFFRSPGLFGIYKSNAFGVLDIGVQKKFQKMRSSLRIACDNVLNTLIFKPSVHLPDQNLDVSGRLQFSYPTIRLTWSQRFGNDKLKGNREHASGAEEKQRVQAN
ncbi:MAG: TonB-dependent receptor domain-containing protein [Flavisolibacter sp.]